jgi:hypothetical protein
LFGETALTLLSDSDLNWRGLEEQTCNIPVSRDIPGGGVAMPPDSFQKVA